MLLEALKVFKRKTQLTKMPFITLISGYKDLQLNEYVIHTLTIVFRLLINR